MELIVGGRRTGKTQAFKQRCDMLHERHEPFAIVCHDSRAAQEYEKLYGKGNVFTAGEIRKGSLRGRSHREALLVENLDMIIGGVFGGRLPTLATITQDEPWLMLNGFDPRRGM